jgi:competence protein ComEC
MSDRWAVLLALATFAGALAVCDGHVRGASLVLAATVVGAGLAVRRPELLCLGAALLAAALAQRSLAGLEAPLATGPVRGEVTLVADPVPDGRGGVTVDVRLGGRRLRAMARSAPAAALDDRLAGERVVVVGEVEPPGPTERWLRHRHLAGRLRIDAVVGWRPGVGVTRLANGLRRTLASGGEALPDRQASLLAGLTLGDDRAQPADMADAFRAAGLTHLLAVSGQNVAFVLVVAAPLLRRLSFGPRLGATLGVLAGFALVTRFEPSVLRATAMAAVAATGAAVGRPASTVRILALGVTGVLLVDPLLAASLGFRLSVAGAAGIVVGAGRLESALPGPRWLAAPLSVTLAAQLAVSPLLVAAFGAVPVASLPANLLAVPAAGPVMVWGLTGGVVAGVAGGPAALVVHLPTRALLSWIDGVATAASRWPLGELRTVHVAWLAVAAAAAVAGREAPRPVDGEVPRGRRGAVLRWAAAVVVLGVVVQAVGPHRRAAVVDGQALGAGAMLWRAGGAGVLVVDGRAGDDRVLAGLRQHRVGRVDVVVLRTPARRAAEVAGTVRRRWADVVVLTPVGAAASSAARGAGGETAAPPAGTVLDVGRLRLTVLNNTADRLDVEVDVDGGHADGQSSAIPPPAPPLDGPVPAARLGGGPIPARGPPRLRAPGRCVPGAEPRRSRCRRPAGSFSA